jgi:hypothetical protein
MIENATEVDPAAETVDHYSAQVRSYLQTMGIIKSNPFSRIVPT